MSSVCRSPCFGNVLLVCQAEVGQLQGQLQTEVKRLQGQLQQVRNEEEEAQEQRHALKLQLTKVALTILAFCTTSHSRIHSMVFGYACWLVKSRCLEGKWCYWW